MNDNVYLKVIGLWHRATMGPEVTAGLYSTTRPITTDPACEIADATPEDARFDVPPSDEPRHATCFGLVLR